MQERRRRKFHAFNKKNSSILLRYAHSLLHFTQLFCYTFYDYILFIMIIIRLSFLLSFLCKFVLFISNFFFHIFVSIICKYTSKYNALENLKQMVMSIYCMKNGVLGNARHTTTKWCFRKA